MLRHLPLDGRSVNAVTNHNQRAMFDSTQDQHAHTDIWETSKSDISTTTTSTFGADVNNGCTFQRVGVSANSMLGYYIRADTALSVAFIIAVNSITRYPKAETLMNNLAADICCHLFIFATPSVSLTKFPFACYQTVTSVQILH